MYESMNTCFVATLIKRKKSLSSLQFIHPDAYAVADAGRTRLSRERGADDTFVAEAGRERLIRWWRELARSRSLPCENLLTSVPRAVRKNGVGGSLYAP